MKYFALSCSALLLIMSFTLTLAEDPPATTASPPQFGAKFDPIEEYPRFKDTERTQKCPPSPQPKDWLMIPHGGLHTEGCERVTLQDLETDFDSTQLVAEELRREMLKQQPTWTPERLKRREQEHAAGIVNDLSQLIKDRDAAVALGKAFFWDMQVGSDGQTACASCHHKAGADGREKSMGIAKRIIAGTVSADDFGTEESAELEESLYVAIYRNRWQHMTDFNDLLAKLAVQGLHRLLASGENLSTARTAAQKCKLLTNDEAITGPWNSVLNSMDSGTSPTTQQETIIELTIGALEFSKLLERDMKAAAMAEAPAESRSEDSKERTRKVRSQLLDGFSEQQQRAAKNLSIAFSPYKDEVEAQISSERADAPKLTETETSPLQGGFLLRERQFPNAPTVVNAAVHDRLFHDGRAASVFNGYDHLGDDAGRDGYGKWTYINGRWRRLLIRLPDASLASQATAPLLSASEMSWFGRQYHHVAKKLLDRTPLKHQAVSIADSHLGSYVDKNSPGLKVTYRDLIRKAFRQEWWAGNDVEPKLLVEEGDSLTGKRLELSQMEANFSLYWGVALMCYQQELISAESEFDRLMSLRRRGETLYPKSISPEDKKRTQEILEGYSVFQEHACADCHRSPEFAGATRATVYGPILEFEGPLDAINAETEENEFANWLAVGQSGLDARIERMPFRLEKAPRFYDSGFYNVGVTSDDPKQPDFDPGVAGEARIHLSGGPQGAQMAISQRFGQGLVSDLIFQRPYVTYSLARRLNDRWSSVQGAFKTPTMRNISLTAPYLHNGEEKTMDGVLNHYAVAGQEQPVNTNLHPALRSVGGEPAETNVPSLHRQALRSFLDSLTDARVRDSKAPFDHPSLSIPIAPVVDELGKARPEDMQPIAAP